jgi:hypothetical protein
MQDEQYILEKSVWTQADYNQMGWHDANVYAIAFDPDSFEFLLDMDYIFKWVQPSEEGGNFSFWVSPVTLAFKNVHSLNVNLVSDIPEFAIADIDRGTSRPTPNGKFTEWEWFIKTNKKSHITFWATDYEQFVRSPAIHLNSQTLSMTERGGISFSKRGCLTSGSS